MTRTPIVYFMYPNLRTSCLCVLPKMMYNPQQCVLRLRAQRPAKITRRTQP
ncbi:hypothetical protein M3J09_009110 [Ascochyta lentis]